MISSTFSDLERHRAELMRALRKEELFPIGMEDSVSIPGNDVIDSSLGMVRKSSAYIGLISHRYGQVVECATRNSRGYSVSRLEFEEAQRLGLPTLIFVMADEHPIIKKDIETDTEKIEKLKAFRARAKAGRIYVEFNSIEDFIPKAIHAVASLRRYLDALPQHSTIQQVTSPDHDPSSKPDLVPSPPAFYAQPAYIGSHDFVGRKAQLDTLSDWAAPADSHPILLFEAIGGAGKSMLTWEWTTRYSMVVREDWAGRFWYSFYEKGAIMADFCRCALAYITGQPSDYFRTMKMAEMGELLLRHFQDRPWLLVLDGLERVLVAYHRFDAAQVPDEEAGTTDKMAQRDPCAAIRPEDDDLLRALASAAPSKLLLTTRLTPRVLLNAASQPIPGVLRERLPGLRPADAEALLRACGVTGTSASIQRYLQGHCDCHPLVTGVLAGLINDYLPDRGNFDAWAADPHHGGQLDLANLDLVQKRNHILHAALASLPEKGRQLLSTLALLSEAVDYPTLSALNPHLPPQPEEVGKPHRPKDRWKWAFMSHDEKKLAHEDYLSAVRLREEYEQALEERSQSPEFHAAPRELARTVRDLERRGLLQYDAQARRYDLHPVVRGIAASGLGQEEKNRYGQRVIDHFSQQAHRPYEEVETLEDVRDDLHVVRALLQMGRHQQAVLALAGDLVITMLSSLETYAEVLSLLRPFFPQGWANPPEHVDNFTGGLIANYAAVALDGVGELSDALAAHSTGLLASLRVEHWTNVRASLSAISTSLHYQGRLASEWRLSALEMELATLMGDKEGLFKARLNRFSQLITSGAPWDEAEAMWQLIDPMGRNWSRSTYRPGMAEYEYARYRFYRKDLDQSHLDQAERLAVEGRNRLTIRAVHRLRAEWQIGNGQWVSACDSLCEAVRMAREIGRNDSWAEAHLALAEFHTKQLLDPRHRAEHLARGKAPSHRPLAELWLAIGDREQAKKHALVAYRKAWADGEPYVYRYELDKARGLLEQLDAEIPRLPPYDPAKDEKLPWEDKVAAAIARLRGRRGEE